MGDVLLPGPASLFACVQSGRQSARGGDAWLRPGLDRSRPLMSHGARVRHAPNQPAPAPLPGLEAIARETGLKSEVGEDDYGNWPSPTFRAVTALEASRQPGSSSNRGVCGSRPRAKPIGSGRRGGPSSRARNSRVNFPVEKTCSPLIPSPSFATTSSRAKNASHRCLGIGTRAASCRPRRSSSATATRR